MKILHICNDYSYTKVHRNLYKGLDSLGIDQIIFNPLRSERNIGNNFFNFNMKTSEIIYSDKLKKHHRFLYRTKIDFLEKDLISKINLKNINIINATTLFSDGAIAYQINKKFNIPYIVSVRNTDIFTFLKYRPDQCFLAYAILKNASKVIFISDANKKSFIEHPLIKFKTNIFLSKSMVINNGIDDFWIDNQFENRTIKPINFLFIGRFDKNKNVLSVIQSFLKVAESNPTIHLNLVGGTGVYHNKVLGIVERSSNISYLGTIQNKETLAKVYRKNDIFIMTSFRETFGLVYIEALTQGLPVIYTMNQGIDGTFKNSIGLSVNPKSISQIENALISVINKRYSFDLSSIEFEKFRWKNVAAVYSNIFNQMIC